jgi:tRNA 5-methylaminomethyl-2-thiouridine biosynthesis bifunctional protein
VFLHGCGLPGAWAGQQQWRILETGFGFGLNFLVTWAAWRADPLRCGLLHFVSTEAWPVGIDDLRRAHAAHPHLAATARELHQQWWGLLPGVHRLRFDEGRVLLTLYVGDAQAMLRQQRPTVDSVYLDGFSPQRNPDIWDQHTLKAVARCCRRGTHLATWTIARAVRDALAQCGFEVQRVPGVPPKRDNLHAVYNPHWEPRTARGTAPADVPVTPGRCIVIGGGMAGAACAASLARRGWQVQVLDSAASPAAGASGLPAGVFAPHLSPDDNVLSRLSRSGVRTTLQQATWLLDEGMDWSACGVLEHRVDGSVGLPAAWSAASAGAQWSIPAPASVLGAAGLPPGTVACWHTRAGWIRPARLVEALLSQPGIQWRGDCAVAQLRPVMPAAGQSDPTGAQGVGGWQALDAQGQVLAEASHVVIAAGAGSGLLLEHRWPLHPVRGQVSWGLHDNAAPAPALAPFPVNGHGNLVPAFPAPTSATGSLHASAGPPLAWVMGSTFERGVDSLPPSPADQRAAHGASLDKLRALLPQAVAPLGGALDAAVQARPSGEAPHPSAARSWAAVRCTSPDRLPIVGPVDAQALPGLWACTAMGSRGLTLALLCGELLAARLHGEPLPLDARLAQALGTERM